VTTSGRLSAADRDAIMAATAAAEAETEAEIVPYVVWRASSGAEEAWQASALGAVIFAAAAAADWLVAGPWQTHPVPWLVLPAAAGAAVGYVAGAYSGRLYRLLAGGSLLDERALIRAKSAFVEETVFDTVDRTGILVFVAWQEHRALVFADEGINARVAPEEWQAIVDRLTAAISRGQVADGMAAAVRECGQLVKERGGIRKDIDENELADAPRVVER
jgi:putative membrane protein